MLPRIFCLVSAADDLALLPLLYETGIGGFQVRDKSSDGRGLLALTSRVLELVPSATVIVNDRPDVALAARAAGVHLGATDLPVASARWLSSELIIGATCRSRSDVERARADGADYAGFGPLFATSSKDGLPAPLGVSALGEACGVLPLIGIAGVTAANAAAVVEAGAHGVAVIGSIWRHPDPLAAAKELVAAVEA